MLMTAKLDILDRLQDEEGFVRLVLTSGEITFGKPKSIVYDEDEEGWETIKTIMFEPFMGEHMMFYGLDDVESYEPYKEEEIPPYE